MKWLINFLTKKETITAVSEGVSKLIKDHKGKPSAKRIFGLVGGGSIITTGLTLIEVAECDESLYVGFGLVALGAIVGLIMGSFISKES